MLQREQPRLPGLGCPGLHPNKTSAHQQPTQYHFCIFKMNKSVRQVKYQDSNFLKAIKGNLGNANTAEKACTLKIHEFSIQSPHKAVTYPPSFHKAVTPHRRREAGEAGQECSGHARTVSLLGGAGVTTQGPKLQFGCYGSQAIVLRDTGTPVSIFLKIELSIPWNSKCKICEILLEQ